MVDNKRNYLEYSPTLKDWQNDRNEFLNKFLTFEYGIRPKEREQKLTYKLINTMVIGDIKKKTIAMYYQDVEMLFHIYVPYKKPVVITEYGANTIEGLHS